MRHVENVRHLFGGLGKPFGHWVGFQIMNISKNSLALDVMRIVYLAETVIAGRHRFIFAGMIDVYRRAFVERRALAQRLGQILAAVEGNEADQFDAVNDGLVSVHAQRLGVAPILTDGEAAKRLGNGPASCRGKRPCHGEHGRKRWLPETRAGRRFLGQYPRTVTRFRPAFRALSNSLALATRISRCRGVSLCSRSRLAKSPLFGSRNSSHAGDRPSADLSAEYRRLPTAMRRLRSSALRNHWE